MRSPSKTIWPLLLALTPPSAQARSSSSSLGEILFLLALLGKAMGAAGAMFQLFGALLPYACGGLVFGIYLCWSAGSEA